MTETVPEYAVKKDKKLKKEKKSIKWSPVLKSRPTRNQRCLVTLAYSDTYEEKDPLENPVIVATYRGSDDSGQAKGLYNWDLEQMPHEYVLTLGSNHYQITAWAPLPMPYKPTDESN